MTHYAIVGGGRLARHMRHYFSLLEIPCSQWTRDTHSDLNTHTGLRASVRLRATIEPASHVLLLVSDGAIAEVLKSYPFLRDKTLIHCSGALSMPGITGAHPLMTFSHELYELEAYSRIPFMLDSGSDFQALLPGLPNPHFHIATEHKARYHALCVMAGNFSQIMWQAVSQQFAALGLPEESLQPYLRQVLQNFIDHPQSALTGPLSRGDEQTIQRNLAALADHPLHDLYQSFLDFHRAGQASPALREVAL